MAACAAKIHERLTFRNTFCASTTVFANLWAKRCAFGDDHIWFAKQKSSDELLWCIRATWDGSDDKKGIIATPASVTRRNAFGTELRAMLDMSMNMAEASTDNYF